VGSTDGVELFAVDSGKDWGVCDSGVDLSGVVSGIVGGSSVFLLEGSEFALVVGELISKPSVSSVMKTLF
jgi:hypothetical protein